MTAAQQAQIAADEMGHVIAAAEQMKVMLGQINAIRIQTREEHVFKARRLMAGAAEIAAGGTGEGQRLQVMAGVSTVKLEELSRLLAMCVNHCTGIAIQAAQVESATREWAAHLSQ